MHPKERDQASASEFGEATLAAMPEHDVTSVKLFRHGHVEGFERRVVRGQLEAALTERGRRQHTGLCQWVQEQEWAPTRIFSSNLGRCAELAEELAQAVGGTAEIEPLLGEQNLGEWQSRSWDEISAESGDAINAYWSDYWNALPPGGESMAQLSTRVLDWWQKNEPKFRGEHVFIITHAGVIRAMLCDWLSIPSDNALRIAPAVASCTSLVFSQAGAVLEGLSERPLLQDTEAG